MLQQTQVKRVLSYWDRWICALPTIDALAAASVADVLGLWQGLGYNRRALAPKQAAEICSEQYAGVVPQEPGQLLGLPGVGPATAAGVCIFAHGQPQVYLETNVRTVFLHHFFHDKDRVSDAELIPLIEATCDREDPGGWYYALLDYGNYLKSVLPNPSRRSKTHTRQSQYVGSVRQKRAFLLREVLAAPAAGASTEELLEALNTFELAAGRETVLPEELGEVLVALAVEGFLVEVAPGWWGVAK